VLKTEILEGLDLTTNNSVRELYESVAERAEATINGISESSRSTILRVHSARRGGNMDTLHTKVSVRNPYGSPFSRLNLLSRWAWLEETDLGKKTGRILRYEQIRSGDVRMESTLPWPDGGIDVRAGRRTLLNNPESATIAENLLIGEMEPGRQELLLGVARRIVASAIAIDQIGAGQDPAEALLPLR
jgi:hypothetical protein